MKKVFIVIFILLFFNILYSQEVSTALSSEGQLRYYGAQSEDFFVSKNYSSIIRVTDGNFTEKKYDLQQRLIREISWNKDISHPIITRDYTYDENSSFVKIMQIDDFSALTRTINTYNNSGLVEKRTVYEIVKKEVEEIDSEINSIDADDDKSDETSQRDISESSNSMAALDFEIDESKTKSLYTKSFLYDEDERLIKEETKFEDSSKKDEKIEYEFKLGDEKADVLYYYDDFLKKSLIHSTSTDWVETTYFSDSLYIQVTYNENSAILEEVYENGKKIRERER